MKSKEYFAKSSGPLVLIVVLFLCLVGCQIQPGPGGMGVITGKVYANDYNANLTSLNSQYYAPEENVYLIYGDHEFYDEDQNSHYDGTFRFEFLRKGTYTVFVYSKDTNLVDANIIQPIFRTVEITEKNQVIDIGDLVIIK